MKTLQKLLFLLLLFSITTQSFAQDKLMSPEDVTSSSLEQLFKSAYIKVSEVKDSYLKIEDARTVYLDIDNKKRFIGLNTVYNLQDNVSKSEILDIFNTINKEVLMVKCYYNESSNTVSFFYHFWMDGGYSTKTLVSTVKLFQQAVSLALTKDVENKIF